MGEYEWTCAGCGVPSPNKIRSCDCATNVVCWDRKKSEWKCDASLAMTKFTPEAINRAEQFVRSIYPLLDDIVVKQVAAKILKSMPKLAFPVLGSKLTKGKT